MSSNANGTDAEAETEEKRQARIHVITLSLHSTASHSYHTRRSYLSVHARRAEHRIPAKAYCLSVTFTPFSTFSLSIAAWVMGLLDVSP
jgi:hypothetical protein